MAIVLGTESKESAKEEDKLFVATESEATPKTTTALIGTYAVEFKELAFPVHIKASKVGGAIFLLTSWPKFLAKKTRSAIANAKVEGDL